MLATPPTNGRSYSDSAKKQRGVSSVQRSEEEKRKKDSPSPIVLCTSSPPTRPQRLAKSCSPSSSSALTAYSSLLRVLLLVPLPSASMTFLLIVSLLLSDSRSVSPPSGVGELACLSFLGAPGAFFPFP